MSVIRVAARGIATGATLCVMVATVSAGQDISSERNDAVPIPAKATVVFPAAPTGGAQLSATVSNDSVYHMIRRALTAQFQKKGYTIVADGTPATFTVRYFLAVNTTADSHAPTAGGVSGPAITGYGLGYGKTADTPLSSLPAPEPVTNANFEVALVDERMGRTAWRGIAEGKPKSGAPTEARINSVVGKVCKSLPAVP